MQFYTADWMTETRPERQSWSHRFLLWESQRLENAPQKNIKKKNKVLADFLSLISSYLKQWWDKDRKMGIQVPPAVGICSEENKWPSCTHIMNRSWCILTLPYVLLVCNSPNKLSCYSSKGYCLSQEYLCEIWQAIGFSNAQENLSGLRLQGDGDWL